MGAGDLRSRWLTTDEAAEYARVSPLTIRRAVKCGLLRAVRDQRQPFDPHPGGARRCVAAAVRGGAPMKRFRGQRRLGLLLEQLAQTEEQLEEAREEEAPAAPDAIIH